MRFRKVFVLTLLFITLIPISFVLSETRIENEEVSLTITINDAYYLDAEGDGVENDVVAVFTLEVHKITLGPSRIHTNIYLKLRLVLPSGLDYIYLLKVLSPNHATETFTAYFYNHATESGWYGIEITGILNKGSAIDTGTEILYFDPPGSTSGTDPLSFHIE